MDFFDAYAAGFFDGEGSICISRVKMPGFSDNHRLGIDVAQHVDRIAILHDFQAHYGGQVRVKKQNRNSFTPGALIANWHLARREDVERFLRAVLPHLRAKAPQARLALQFIEVAGWSEAARAHGRFSGRRPLTAEQIEGREDVRLQMRALNTPSHRAAV